MIANAKLEFYCTKDVLSTMAANSEIYLPKKDWVLDEANWFEFSKGNNWGSEGGDIGLSSVAKVALEENMAGKWISYDITDAVKDIKSGKKENRGFMTVYDGPDHHEYASSEYEDESLRPRLVVESTGSSVITTMMSAQKAITATAQNNSLTVQTSGSELLSLSLYSLRGEQISLVTTKGYKGNLSTLGISAGQYILQAVTTAGVKTVKIRIGE